MITSPFDFERVMDALSSATVITARLPAQVFQSRYDTFRFLEFDLFPNTRFWAMLQHLMAASGDLSVNVVALEPDPKSFFHTEFGYFGGFSIPVSASADRYRTELWSGSPSSHVDSLEVISTVLFGSRHHCVG
jgi:hypothetical protein